MSDHNFYDSLTDFAERNPLRLHMPGHKGKEMPMKEWNALAPLDFTELGPTGDLYGGDDWLEDAQRIWAWDWGMDTAFFCTGGSTQGLFTLFSLFTRPGDRILVDRVSHKSIHNAMALLDLRPVWLPRPWDQAQCTQKAVELSQVEQLLNENPGITAVVITTPTYYGVMTPLEEIAACCHRHGAKLIVDGAHGAHLPLVLRGKQNCILGYNPYACCDGVTVSTHKTLPAPGQTAVVFANHVSMSDIRRASALTSTTSPSFVMMAALDKLRSWMWEHREHYCQVARWCEQLRRAYPTLTAAYQDPCRLVFQVENGKMMSKKLQDMGIYPEMEDRHHVVAILTAADEEKDLLRLTRALNFYGYRGKPAYVASLEAPPIPTRSMEPREARFAPTSKCHLERAVGRTAAEVIAPYPPGVPVVSPGEVIDEKILAYLYELCYDKSSVVLVTK